MLLALEFYKSFYWFLQNVAVDTAKTLYGRPGLLQIAYQKPLF